MTKFEVGATYWTRETHDHNMVTEVTIKSRTKCFVSTECGKRCKVSASHDLDGNIIGEGITPNGKYAFCTYITSASQVPTGGTFNFYDSDQTQETKIIAISRVG